MPIFIVRKEGNYGHLAIVKDPIYYEDTGDRKADDYNVTLKMTQIVEEVIKEYPDNWLWFQHRWNTPYTPPEEKELKQGENKGLLLIAGGIAIAAAIIAWLMFGGEAPKNPENTASNAVSAVVKTLLLAASRTADACGSFRLKRWKAFPAAARL